jgi:hypothetical protein
MSPRLTPRQQEPKTAIERRAEWRALAAAAIKTGERAVATDGRELLDLIHYQHRLATTGKTPFPADGVSAAGLAAGFVLIARAFQNVQTERRRAIVAAALVEAAKAVDAYLTEDQVEAAQPWLKRIGGD